MGKSLGPGLILLYIYIYSTFTIFIVFYLIIPSCWIWPNDVNVFNGTARASACTIVDQCVESDEAISDRFFSTKSKLQLTLPETNSSPQKMDVW